jgi:hypothetical protein
MSGVALKKLPIFLVFQKKLLEIIVENKIIMKTN